MKIIYEELKNDYRHIYKFRISESILKKHYKALARLSDLFNVEARNSGYILKADKAEFLDLLQEIEKSSDKECEKSHERALKKYNKQKNRLSFEDYCEDFLDLDISLMTKKERTEAFTSYKSM